MGVGVEVLGHRDSNGDGGTSQLSLRKITRSQAVLLCLTALI